MTAIELYERYLHRPFAENEERPDGRGVCIGEHLTIGKYGPWQGVSYNRECPVPGHWGPFSEEECICERDAPNAECPWWDRHVSCILHDFRDERFGPVWREKRDAWIAARIKEAE